MSAQDKAKRPETPAAAPPKLPAAPIPARRNFLSGFLAIIIGGIVAIFPFAAGLAVFTDPLRKKSGGGGGRRDENGFVRIFSASLDTLPMGEPKQFAVIDDLLDAWNVFPNEPIGGVYLTRVSENEVRALNVTCPHAGCDVNFVDADKVFRCPCHDSSFKPDGELATLKSPAPRGLDPLEVQIKNGNEIWVKYVKFVGACAERIVES